MEDDCTEEEIENELAPIVVQLAYVQHVSFDVPFVCFCFLRDPVYGLGN